MASAHHSKRDPRPPAAAPAPPASRDPMCGRVVEFFMFLDAPDRLWARDYVLAWRDGASELSKDLAALLRGVAGLRAAPFCGVCVGPAPDGNGVFANELCTLMVPVARAGSVTVGVYLDRMSLVHGFPPFATPAMPTVEDGVTRSRGRFALDSVTGELVSLASTSVAPSLFPDDSMTSMFHWRSQGRFNVFTNSYLVDHKLPQPPASLRAVDLANATLQSSTFCFLRSPCASCGELPPGCSPCSCFSLAGSRVRRMREHLANPLDDPSVLSECRYLERTRAVEQTLNGQFEGVSNILIRLNPTAPMVQITRPGVSLRASFMDDPGGDELAAQMQMLSIRSVVQSASTLAQRPAIPHPGTVATRLHQAAPEAEQLHCWRNTSPAPPSPVGVFEPLTDPEFSGPSSPEQGDWGFSASPPMPTLSQASVLVEKASRADDPLPSVSVDSPTVVTNQRSAARGSAGENPPREPAPPPRSALEILEERRRKNRQSAKMSGLKRKKNMEDLERNVRQIRVVRLDLEARKASLEAENLRLREQIELQRR